MFIGSRSGDRFFLSATVRCSPTEWSARTATQVQGKVELGRTTENPLDKHCEQVYAFGPSVTDAFGGVSQQLGWVSRQAGSVAREVNPVA